MAGKDDPLLRSKQFSLGALLVVMSIVAYVCWLELQLGAVSSGWKLIRSIGFFELVVLSTLVVATFLVAKAATFLFAYTFCQNCFFFVERRSRYCSHCGRRKN